VGLSSALVLVQASAFRFPGVPEPTRGRPEPPGAQRFRRAHEERVRSSPRGSGPLGAVRFFVVASLFSLPLLLSVHVLLLATAMAHLEKTASPEYAQPGHPDTKDAASERFDDNSDHAVGMTRAQRSLTEVEKAEEAKLARKVCGYSCASRRKTWLEGERNATGG
jgi:ribosome modulation factor